MRAMLAMNAILVPTDFSPHSDHALRCAVGVGERWGSTIHLLHVFTLNRIEGECGPGAIPDLASLLRQAERIATDRLTDDASRQHGPTVSVIKSLTRAVNAYEAVVDYAVRKSIDLVVISTRGATGSSTRAPLGSVAERVVRYSPCPVLVVGAPERDLIDPETGAVTLDRVVVADNLSTARTSSLADALRLLDHYRPAIHLVHAVEAVVPPAFALAGLEPPFPPLDGEVRGRLTRALEARAAELVPLGWAVTSALLEGSPSTVVPRYAAETGADLIVTAAETRIDAQERLLGGTTERIVRNAPCPTLVV
jgi:nucleotide-binding universal stress UspA family protein